MKKWKTIRDGYIRSERLKTKSGQGSKDCRTYHYARQLEFLQIPNIKGKRKSSLDVEDSDVENPEESDETIIGESNRNDDTFDPFEDDQDDTDVRRHQSEDQAISPNIQIGANQIIHPVEPASSRKRANESQTKSFDELPAAKRK